MAASEAQKRASMKYTAKAYDRLYIQVKKGFKEVIEEAAKKDDKSLNSYVVEAINKELVASGNPSILGIKDGE